MKKIVLCLGLIYGLSVGAQTVQTVDISTGVNNPPGTGLQSVGAFEDTWTSVTWPGNPPFWSAGSVNPRCTTLPAHWNDPGCARWITPSVHPTLYYPLVGPPTTYTYSMTFNANSGCVATAWLSFNSIGGDDQITAIKVNGYNHAVSGYGFSPVSSNVTIPLTQSVNSEINPGASNTIEVVVSNTAGGQETGLYLCGTINIAYGTVTPTITTSTSTFCAGAPLTFSSSVVGHASSHFWEIAECNSSGVVTPGGYVWNNGFAYYQGDPGTYTFPATLPLVCGKYYKIKLACLSQCSPWAETNKVIYLACNPTANAGVDQTICYGDCATITSRTGAGLTYLWATDAGTVGTSAGITLCPTTTTTYTYTVTNTSTGCAASDAVTINVLNDPSFDLYYSPYSGTSYYIDAVPRDGTAYTAFGFTSTYKVREMNGSTPYYYYGGGSCNWGGSYPTYSEQFSNFISTPGWFNTSTCTTQGTFLYGHLYRITRIVYNNTCGYDSTFTDVIQTRSLPVDETATSVNDVPAVNDFSVYPNPSTDVFTVTMSNATKASIEVYDALGKKVKAMEQNGSKSVIDLTGFPKGVYMINVISNGTKTSRKIILE